MKIKAFILTILAASLVFQVSAKVWRVNNRTILSQTVSADFTTLQAAINGASANDTIYIEGSSTSYGNGIIDKPLVIIGTGYFLTENDTTQAYQNQSMIGQLIFDVGSEGSVVMGFYIYEDDSHVIFTVNCVHIKTDGITLKKNRIHSYNPAPGAGFLPSTAYSIIVDDGLQDVHILQNFISSKYTAPGISRGLSVGAAAKCLVSNNIFNNTDGITANDYAVVTSDNGSNDVIISNNVIYNYHFSTYYTTHINNILLNGTYNGGAGDYTTNNLCSGTQYPNLYGNQQNVDMSNVFVNYGATVDSGFVLKAAPNPAIDTGLNGGDCGVFSNDTGDPYVLSGMPDIPATFSVTVNNPVGVNLIPINIKAISHNEGK